MARLFADLSPLRASADYRRIILAHGVSNIGQQMTAVAVGIQVYALTQSSLAVGLVGLFQLVPLIGFGLYGGALSDTHDRRTLGLVAALGLMGCAGILVAQSALGLGSVAVLYAVVAIQSAFFAIGNPARQAIIPRLIGPEMLPAANALGMLAWGLGFTVGPLVGGFVIAATGGVAWAYAADLVLFTGVVYAMWRLRPMPARGGCGGPAYAAGPPSARACGSCAASTTCRCRSTSTSRRWCSACRGRSSRPSRRRCIPTT